MRKKEKQQREEAAGLELDMEIPQEEQPEQEQLPKPRKRRKGVVLIVLLISIFVAACIGAAGYFVHESYYVLPVDAISVDGEADSMLVQVQAGFDEALLQVVCVDAYGTRTCVPLQDGQASFSNLAPDSVYRIELLVDGFHKLSGKTTASYTTPPKTEILQFDAVTGSEDGSVILAFLVDGPENGPWSVAYSASDEEEKVQEIEGHTIQLTGLTVGKHYTFRLISGEGMYVTGPQEIRHTASKLIYAEDLQIISCVDRELTAVWTVPEYTPKCEWTVRCHNDTYDETIVTKETTAVFAGLNTADGYTVDVTAAGMSVSQRTEVGENSVTVSNFQADTTDPTKLALSWDAQPPAGGWTLHYSIDGGESFKTVTAEANAATITPLLPDTEYIFNLEAASGVDVLTLPLSWKAPEAVDFSGYGVTPENIQVQLCKSTDAVAWETEIPEDASFSSRFAAGEKISMVIRLPQGAGTSDDSMQILYVIRDQDGKIVSYASNAGTWATMWNETFGVFDIMQLPETAGGYRVSLYFNGLFITDETFSIVE